MLRSFILSIVFITAIGCFSSISQTINKTIHVTVRHPNGTMLEGAEVTFKGGGLFAISSTKITNADGQANFDIKLISSKVTGTISVRLGWDYSFFQKSITLIDRQDYYDFPIQLTSSSKKVTVTVRDEKAVLSNAKVTLKGARAPRDEVGYTDENGISQLEITSVENSKIIPVTVEKEGYKIYRADVTINYKEQMYSVEAKLEKDPTAKLLRVTLLASDDRSPIAEASIEATGPTQNDYYSGFSDVNGIANIVIKTGGEYSIYINHNKFKPVTQKMTLNRYDDKEIPPVNLTLERKESKEKRVSFIVTAFTQNGSDLKPVPNAEITVENYHLTTGTDGKADFGKMFYIGNVLNVSAKAKNYETYANKYTIESDQRYTSKEVFENWVILKYKPEEVKMIVKVLDEKTNRPIGNASVTIKTNTGKVIDFGIFTNAQGEAEFNIKTADLVNTALKVTANAADYQERWSDIPTTMTTTSELGMYTIFLKKKEAAKEPGEKTYGPYTITPGAWLPTGLKLKKGQSFRVEASGIIQYKDPPNTQNTPDGGGYWGWWQLKGKINEQIIGVGSRGGGTASADGMIELGAPATVSMGHAEEKALEGHYTVYVFSKYAVEDKSPKQRLQAEKELEFLGKILRREKITTLTLQEKLDAIKLIISNHDLQKIKEYGMDDCLKTIQSVLAQDVTPSKVYLQIFNDCMNTIINELKEKTDS